jgi:hypothetical protein
MGFIHHNRATIDPDGLKKVERGLARRTGIQDAVKEWPKWLTGNTLPKSSSCSNLVKFMKYRNALIHGKITEVIPSSGQKLAQDIETVDNAELALQTVSDMIKATAQHFGFQAPSWVQASGS